MLFKNTHLCFYLKVIYFFSSLRSILKAVTYPHSKAAIIARWPPPLNFITFDL